MSDIATEHERSAVRATFFFIILSFVISGTVAAIYGRGLYQDGAYYLYRMAEREWFYLVDPARTTVHALRQAPVVAMLKFGNLSLFHLGQIFSLAMLLLPPLLVSVCWFIVPRDQKVWTLLPAIQLLVGFSTTSLEAVGEASIATSYFWILLFLLLFRTRRPVSQLVFLALLVPTLHLHEGLCLLMPILLLAMVLRRKTDLGWPDRIFLGCATIIIVAIILYELKWMIYAQIPADRNGELRGMATFGFLYLEGHVNLPVITALVAIAALAATLFFHDAFLRVFGRSAGIVAVAFALFALATIAIAWHFEASLSPPSQAISRYNSLYASIVLGVFATLAVSGGGVISWARSPTLTILIFLCLAQTGTDLSVTERWRLYIHDFQGRLAKSEGLVDWTGAVVTTDNARESNWRLMTVGWVHPIMSIILSRNGDVRSILDYPPGTPFQPLDLSDRAKLPSLRGVSFDNYKRSVGVSPRVREGEK